MTHYSRYCLHLGCGEPLGNALGGKQRARKATKVLKKQSRRKSGKQVEKKDT